MAGRRITAPPDKTTGYLHLIFTIVSTQIRVLSDE